MAPVEGEPATLLTVGWLYLAFRFATTPSLRDTSPQGEAFVWLPLRGAGGVAVCGVALFSLIYYLLLGRPMIAPTNVKLSSF